MKCKCQVSMVDAKQITMRNGRNAWQGTCPTCGTKVFKLGKG